MVGIVIQSLNECVGYEYTHHVLADSNTWRCSAEVQATTSISVECITRTRQYVCLPESPKDRVTISRVIFLIPVVPLVISKLLGEGGKDVASATIGLKSASKQSVAANTIVSWADQVVVNFIPGILQDMC
ncbi:hypothetical protein J6590_087286 [Homalodisca vitripennis]|nr:hypothetical protein J6590_087286 [Homalodisca vitripennis]